MLKTKKELKLESMGKGTGVKKELCAVTNKVARYRDPTTGIAYRDRKAFAVLRGVVSGNFVWSGALGCYVGGRARAARGDRERKRSVSAGTTPAKGVPKRFLSMGFAAPLPPPAAPGPVPAPPQNQAVDTPAAQTDVPTPAPEPRRPAPDAPSVKVEDGAAPPAGPAVAS